MAGDITAQKADAIVSSDNCFLQMSHGVSLAIRRAAGSGVLNEVARYGQVLPGRAVVTSAGALKARFLFHAVTIGLGPQGGVFPNRDLLSEIMASFSYHADTLSLQTIAFPLLGTGGAGFSKPVCLDTMFRFLVRTLLHGLTSVREVRVVILE